MGRRLPKSDSAVKKVAASLEAYHQAHSEAQINVYRYGPASIRVRILDPAFQRMDRGARHDLVWSFLESLPADVLSEVSFLLLLSPSEVKSSAANQEFESPTPLGL